MAPHRDGEAQVRVPLTWAAANPVQEDDLDTNGILPPPALSTHSSRSSLGRERTAIEIIWLRFSRFWRRIPSSWSVERDPAVAARHLLTLFGFISLCIFVFSVPGLLYIISPHAPTPPGTAPELDEAAAAISGKNGAVAADHAECSELGVKVLRDMDGNAVDAMVSTVLCQGILAPFASGLGGGAFILVHREKDGISKFYDARETAPAAATMAMYAKNATFSKFGGLAVAVPGELRGLYRAHSDMGRLPWKTVVEPAIEIAENAKVGQFLAIKLRQMNETIFSSPSLRNIFTKRVLTKKAHSQADAEASVELPGGRRNMESLDVAGHGVVETLSGGDSMVADANDEDKHGVTIEKGAEDDKNGTYTVELLDEGDKISNEALVQTLKQIAEKGPDALYIDLAEKLAKEVRDAGGIMTSSDLRKYRAVKREPIEKGYEGFSIILAPLPSVGGVSIGMALGIMRELQFRRKGRNGVSYKMFTETLKWVFGASMGLGDPSFVKEAPRQMWQMLSRREVLRRVGKIVRDSEKTFRPSHYTNKISTSRLEDGTSHISILDRNGTAVSVTSSINLPFGAGLVSNCSGILLNDQMDGFTTRRTRVNAFGVYPTAENNVAGGKRPVSSMSPSIVLKDGMVYMVVGGSGGPKAVSGVLQTVMNVIDFGDNIADAISAPRLHHQLVPNSVSLEGANGTSCEERNMLKRPSTMTSSGWKYWSSVCQALVDVGHVVDGPAVHGAVQAVIKPGALRSGGWWVQGGGEEEEEKKGGLVYAASDPRRIGKAAAY